MMILTYNLVRISVSKLHSYKMYISNQINSEMLELIIYDTLWHWHINLCSQKDVS